MEVKMPPLRKKLSALVAFAALVLLRQEGALDIDPETMMQLTAAVSAYLIGQGVADMGKGAVEAAPGQAKPPIGGEA